MSIMGTGHGPLTVKATMTLDLEATRWKYAAAKDTRIRELFSESPTAYYARLGALLEQPAALAYAPQLVRRLQRLREQRRAQRSGVRFKI